MTGNESAPPPLQGIHHLKLPVSDLDASLTFYERAFGGRRIPEADHRRASDGSLYAYILTVPGLGTALELRLDPERAERHRLFDPVTIAVRDRATLDAWDEYLTGSGHRPLRGHHGHPGLANCRARSGRPPAAPLYARNARTGADAG